jgi:hypothetical protein
MGARFEEPPLTEAQLQLAYRHLARPGWPDTLQAALADPVRGPCVRGLARQFSRERAPTTWRYVPPTPAGAPPVPATPSTARTATPPKRMYAPRFDCKRAAANDFDD